MTTARKLIAGAGALAAASLVLSGCSGAAPGPAETTAAAGSVDLRMTVWTANEAHLALFEQIAEEYKATHPEIGTITFDALPAADYNTTLTTQIAGGNSPDLVWMGDISYDLIAADSLVDLTAALQDEEGWDYDDLLDSVTAEFSRDGTLYAYPFSNSPFGLYINTSLLAEAGVDLPTGALSWDEVAEMGAEVNSATGKAGFVIRDFDYSNWNYLGTVWPGWGASAWSEDGATCLMDSDEMVEAFEFLHTAAFETGAMPGPGTTADFFAGDAAFTVAQISRASLLDGSFDFELVPLPSGPIGTYSVIGQAGLGALASGAHVQEATDFLAFFTNPENAALLSQFFPPPRESLLTAEQLAANNPKLSEEQLQAVVVDQIGDAVTLPNHTNPAEILQKGKTALDALWTPDADVRAALTATCEAIQPILSR